MFAAFLRKVPARKLIDFSMKTLTPEDSRKNIGLPFVPAIEDDYWDLSGAPFEREERFITEQPRDLMKRGAFNKIPYITGYNSHEAMLFLRSMFNTILRLSNLV